MNEGTGVLNYKRELSDEQKVEGEQLLQEIEPLIKSTLSATLNSLRRACSSNLLTVSHLCLQ